MVFGDAEVFAQKMESFVTWWIPLPEAIDLPDKHRRAITKATRDLAHARANNLEDDGSWHIAHQLRFTIHQREYTAELVDPLLDVLWSLPKGAPPPESQVKKQTHPNPQSHYLSVIEAEVLLPADQNLDKDGLSELFDYVLERIRQLQEATALITKNLVKDWIARERLPVVIPMRLASDAVDDATDDGMGAFVLSPNTLSTVNPPEPLQGQSIEQLEEYLENDDAGVAFTAYHKLRYETMVLYHRRGDYRMTVVSAAIAAEALINEMLQLLFWDEGRYPEEVAPKFNPDETSVLKRVISEYPRHLGGGRWRTDKRGAIRDWREKIAEPRNEIVHAGAMPSSHEAQDALATLTDLERFMGQRLLEKKAQRPRTAILYHGVPRLESKGEMTNRLRRLVESEREPHWASTFARWRDVLETEVQKARGTRIKDDPDNAVLRVVVKDSQAQLVLLDEVNSRAALVSSIPKQVKSEYDRLTQDMEKLESDDGVVIPLILKDSDIKRGLVTANDWDYAYKLVPGFEVMSNGRDVS